MPIISLLSNNNTGIYIDCMFLFNRGVSCIMSKLSFNLKSKITPISQNSEVENMPNCCYVKTNMF